MGSGWVGVRAGVTRGTSGSASRHRATSAGEITGELAAEAAAAEGGTGRAGSGGGGGLGWGGEGGAGEGGEDVEAAQPTWLGVG